MAKCNDFLYILCKIHLKILLMLSQDVLKTVDTQGYMFYSYVRQFLRVPTIQDMF